MPILRLPRPARLAAALAALLLGGCRDRGAPPPPPATAADSVQGGTSLGLFLPDSMGWNHDDSVRVSVTNHGPLPLAGAVLEVSAPRGLRLGRDSAAVSGDTTRGVTLRRPLATLAGGGSVALWWRLSTPPAPIAPVPPPPGAAPLAGGARHASAAPKPDTTSRFLLRVRVLDAAGTELAAAQDTVQIRAGSAVTVGGCGNPGDQVVITRFGIGPVRVGMPVDALRTACPEARDSSWRTEGAAETGLLVLPGGVPVLAVTAGGRVTRIVLDRPGLATASGAAVGDSVGALRERFGRMCAGRAAGRVAVWFPNAPGLSFGLDSAATRGWGAAQATPDSIPDPTRVSSLWVRGGSDDCPARPGEGNR